MLIEIKNKEEFEEKVLKAEKVLVDFYAGWCGPCRMLGPILENVAEENEDILIAKVNIELNEELALQYQVMSIPTLILMKKGEPVHTELGLKSKDEILAIWNK